MFDAIKKNRAIAKGLTRRLVEDKIRDLSDPTKRSIQEISYHNRWVVFPMLDLSCVAQPVHSASFFRTLQALYFEGLSEDHIRGIFKEVAEQRGFEKIGSGLYYGPLPTGQLEFPFVGYSEALTKLSSRR